MPRAPASLCVGVVAYFLAMAGISLLGLKLSSVVTAKTIALSLPYVLDKNPRKPSRIEQRRIDVAQAVPPMPIAKVVALEEPAVSYDVLAAQLDLAETEDLKAGAGATLPKHLSSGAENSLAEPSTTLSVSPPAHSDEMMSLGGVRRAKFRKRLASKFATPPAADAFNRNFGVIPIASN